MRLLSAATLGVAAGVTPVQKVIQLLNDMKAKGEKEMKAEQGIFEEFSLSCRKQKQEIGYAIDDGKAEVQELNVKMAKNDNIAIQASEKIKAHTDTIQAVEAELKTATFERKKAKEAFEKMDAEHSSTLRAVVDAKETLKAQAYNRGQADALLQKLGKVAPYSDALSDYLDGKTGNAKAFLAQATAKPLGQPDVAAYEHHMGPVLKMLEDLRKETEDAQYKLQTEEANSVHAFKMLKADLEDELSNENKALRKQKGVKANGQSNYNDAKTKLATTESDLEEDTQYQKDLLVMCETKTREFGERQKLRAEEITAISEATKVLASGDVSGAADKHLPSMVQTAPTLLQISAHNSLSAAQRVELLKFLQQRSRDLNSEQLAIAAVQVLADPFVKVKNLIKQLLAKLEDEHQKEATAKALCDKQLKENKEERESLSATEEDQEAIDEQLKATLSKLNSHIATLTSELQTIATNQAEADGIRAKEKLKNEETIADSKAAQIAVAKATEILSSFYEKASGATSLMQQKHKRPLDVPGTWDSSYKGMQEENGGIIGILEVIQSDFARLEAETTQEENEASKAYATLSAENKKVTATKSEKKLGAERDVKRRSFDKSQNMKDLVKTRKRLELAMETRDTLQQQCVNTGLSFEDRVRKREEEIAALEEALEFLK